MTILRDALRRPAAMAKGVTVAVLAILLLQVSFGMVAKIHTVMMAAVAMERFSSFITLLDLPAAPPYCLDLKPHNELG